MSEEIFYSVIGKFLERKGFKYHTRWRIGFSKAKIEKYGQEWLHFDVFGYGIHGTWIIECKKLCTIAQFGEALGQLIIDKKLVEDRSIRKTIEIDLGEKLHNPFFFFMALGESNQYTLRQQKATFEEMLGTCNLPYGILLITKDKKVKEIIRGRRLNII